MVSCYASALPNQHHQWRSSLCRLSQRRMATRVASWAWARSWPSSTNCPCLGGREPGLLTGPQRDEGKRGLGTARSPSQWRRSVWWVESNRTINGEQMYLELHRPEKGQEWLLIARLICCLSSLLACCPLSKSIIDLLCPFLAPERPCSASCPLFVPSSVRQTAGLVCQPETQWGTSFTVHIRCWHWTRKIWSDSTGTTVLRLWARLKRNPEEESLCRLGVEQDRSQSGRCIIQPWTEWWRL